MAKIPFKVSARTARLIGRENIASSRGAIIELVKNSSDADANTCSVFFDNKYTEIPERISEQEYQYFTRNGLKKDELENFFKKEGSSYVLKGELSVEKRDKLEAFLAGLNHLYVIDDGEGMTQQIIEDFWMTIGTDNKLSDVFSKKGRVKAGAKGIGRFALDKLGDFCELTTKFNPKIHKPSGDQNSKAFLWQVRWSDFEGHNKTIDKVEAELIGLDDVNLKNEVEELLKDQSATEYLKKSAFQSGTIIDISDLRDKWTDYFVNQLYSDLEVLVPPEETKGIEIYLFSSLEPEKYGRVRASLCDDYDYKLVAKANDNQEVEIEIFRNEYDVETIDSVFFEREEMQKYPYRFKDFKRGKWTMRTSFSELLPGYKDIDKEGVFEKIGAFEFTFYFMKRTYSSPDQKKFFYNSFMSNVRKDWLDRFGGVKIFRDNFRVRPYGEVDDVAFDWLGLGARKASSPASPSKKGGGYKVEPDNIAGTIKISRLSNIEFEDKSSREGLQENRTFAVFKRLILNIIDILEVDRAYIARQMFVYDDEKNRERISREQAEKLAKRILEQKRKEQEAKNKKSTNENTSDEQSSNEVVLSELVETQKEEIERLVDEQKILRGLASSGIVVASFNHELSNLKDVLGSRMDDLKLLLSDKIKPADYTNTKDFLNPFVLIEDIKAQDLKMRNWLRFSIGAARKDKRLRRKIDLANYFERLKSTWLPVLENRGISFHFQSNSNGPIEMRVFEIDLDSIFNNLIVNSIDAFLRNTKSNQRKINLDLGMDAKNIMITYSDNGPGLSKDIKEPEKIFEALFTTKRDVHTGEEIGTGLGMWLVKTITSDNDGRVQLLNLDSGFGLRISLPHKYKSKK